MSAAVRKGGLGKGLSALFEDIEVVPAGSGGSGAGLRPESDENGIFFLDINLIAPNRNQPRKFFRPETIEELAASIKAHGVLQPIMVRSEGEGYELVAGERRWRAARKAGLKTIPCIIRELTEEQNILIALIENMQREDLNPMEEAGALERMAKQFGMTQEEISKSVGKSRPYITNILRLLKLPEGIQQMLAEEQLSTGHARALINIEDPARQMALARRAVEDQLSVREMEKLARMENTSRAKPLKRKKSIEIKSVEEELRSLVGTKVEIKPSGAKGKIEIRYFSREELERIIELLRKIK